MTSSAARRVGSPLIQPGETHNGHRERRVEGVPVPAVEGCFDEHGSEIETAARDTIAVDFGRIAVAYGFDADIEELVATRDW